MATALLFPGQGSQCVGMGQSLYRDFSVARDTFREAEHTLQFPIGRLCFEGPEAELQLTENAQPAILTASIAAVRVLRQEVGIDYRWVAGHSLGEYSALVTAGVLSFTAALRAVRRRGELMQRAVPLGQGAMAAVVGLSGGEVEELCTRAAEGEVVSPANFNGGGQVVVAGHKGAVGRLKELAHARGAKAVVDLKVSAPFHCSLMEPAACAMKDTLEELDFAVPQVPVITNVEAAPCTEPERLRELLIAQITSPVRWEESMRTLACCGCTRALEIGPGKVLSRLARRMDLDLPVVAVGDSADLAKLMAGQGERS